MSPQTACMSVAGHSAPADGMPPPCCLLPLRSNLASKFPQPLESSGHCVRRHLGVEE